MQDKIVYIINKIEYLQGVKLLTMIFADRRMLCRSTEE